MDIYGCQPTFMCPETANLRITDCCEIDNFNFGLQFNKILVWV